VDFAFSDEQEMLREQAASFLASKMPHKRVVELAGSDDGWDPSVWREIAGLGWLGLSVPEDLGGAGYGFLEEAVLFEEMGRTLFVGPYFSTVALALPALERDEETLQRVMAGEEIVTLAWAEEPGPTRLSELDAVGTKAESSNGAWSLTGDKVLVPDAGIAARAVIVAQSPDGVGLFLADVGSPEVASTMDPTRRLGKLKLTGAEASLLGEPADSSDLLERIRLRALAALSLEGVGVAQTALDLAFEHAKERKQFDKPIGTYQAISHQIADTYVATELARSLAYWAAWCVAEGDERAPVAVAAAKSHSGAAAVAACERSIQVHGGIGFTWEHVLHRYYKRAQWIESFDGYGSAHRATIAASLLD
jgi:alkylation response protein AidB-like acyl-CoA dehydrogenase